MVQRIEAHNESVSFRDDFRRIEDRCSIGPDLSDDTPEKLDIPVFHDDQHGTAIVVTAGIINSLKIIKKEWSQLKIVVAGAGAAGLSICRLLQNFGPSDIILTNRKGIVYEGRPDLNPVVQKMAKVTNKNRQQGTLADALVGADIFIGVSGPNLVTTDMIKTMNKDPIVFALANPIPEIMPEDAFAGGARIVATVAEYLERAQAPGNREW